MGIGRPAIALLLAFASAPAAAAESAAAAYDRAVEHCRHGRWPEAEAALTQFLAEHPQQEEAAGAMFLRAECRLQRSDFQAARSDFQAFLQQYPDHGYARQALFRVGETAWLLKHSEARAELTRFRERYPDDPLNGYVLNYLGEIALSAREVLEAQTLFRESLRRFPTGPLSDQSRWGLARSLESQGDVQAARDEYRRLVQDRGPLADRAQVQLGISYYSRGRYDEAASELQQAVEDWPGSPLLPQARYWLGMSRLAEGRWSDARQILKHAIADHVEHPLVPAMTHWLAETHRREGDRGAAAACHERVWTQWPDSDWADDSLAAATELALAADHLPRVEELASRFQDRYPTSPLRPRVQQAAGRALLKSERFDEAVAMLEQSLRPAATPANADAAAVADADVPTVADADADAPGAAEGAAATASQGVSSATVPVRTPGDVALEQAGWYYLAQAYLGNDQPEAALVALDQIDEQLAGEDLQLGLQLARATAWVELQQYARAIPVLETYLASRPNGAAAAQCQLQLIVALARSNQWDRASELQEQLSTAAPQDPAVWKAAHRLAEAAYDVEEYDRAAACFRRLTAEDVPPDYAARGRSGLAWCHYQQGQLELAAENFEQLCTAHPDSELAREGGLMRAKCLEQLGRAAAAVEVYLGLLPANPDLETEATALFEAARLQETLGQPASALELLDRLLAKSPQFPRTDAALYQRAWLLLDLQRAEEAESAFEQLSREHPGSRYWSDATYRLAEQAARDQRIERAESLVSRLLESPHTSDEIRCYAFYLQSQLAAAGQRWPEVIAPLEQLLEQDPGGPLELPARYWIAEAHFRQQDYARAAEAFERLTRQIGPQGESWLGMIPLRQAQILLQQEQWREAAEIAEGIPARFPGFRQQHEADYVIGRCLAAQGRFDQARQAYERVIRSPEGGQTETAATAQWMIGETYMHQQDYARAIRAFQQVDDLFAYPRWQAAALLQAGKCLELQGEPGEASRAFQRLLDNHPHSPFAREASARLRRLSPPVNETAQYQDPLR